MERPPLIVSGSTYPKLAIDVTNLLGGDYCSGVLEPYKDGEIHPQLSKSVRKRDVYIIQSLCPPDINKSCMELFFMISACVTLSANEITVVCPYTAYARGDRLNEQRTTIPIGDLLRIIWERGAKRFMTIDLHQEASLAAFSGAKDHLYSSKILVPQMKKEIAEYQQEKNVIAATDQGGAKMVEAYARLLRNAGIKIDGTAYAIQNRHPITNKKELTGVTGNVKGAHVRIVDDVLASGGTAITAANAFMDEGAESVGLVIPHGLFLDSEGIGSSPISALSSLRNSSIKRIMITDTVRLKEDVLAATNYITVVKSAPLIAAAIACVHNEDGESLTENLDRYLDKYTNF